MVLDKLDELRHLILWKTIDRKKQPYEDKYAKIITTILQHAGVQVERTYQRTQSLSEVVQDIRDTFTAPLAEVYEDLYRDVENAFGRDALRQHLSTTKKGFDAAPEHVKGNNWDTWDPFSSAELVAWNKKAMATRISGLSQTTAKDAKRVIEKGIADGTSTEKIAKQLRTSYGYTPERAQRIAQTEVNSASNAVSHFSMKANIPPGSMEKYWIATGDKRVRDTHRAAHGQTRAFNDPFNVGGASLMFPGDTSLGAGGRETIRCRCTEGYQAVATVFRKPVRKV